MDELIIKLDRDDSLLGLAGELKVDGFSGRGEGWFNETDVRAFCAEVKKMSKDMVGATELIGSQCKGDGSEYLEVLALRCYILSVSKLNGIIGIHIKLAEPDSSDCRKEEIKKVSGELKVRNHKANEFADNLLKLILGPNNEVRLLGDLSII